MLGTDFRTGSPVWLDLGSPDTDASAAFYGAVFGWQFASAGPEAGGYGFFLKDGRTVAALGHLTEPGAAPAWMTYFHTDDIQATARAVVAGGGTVRVEPMSVGEGSMAQFTDPQGARFAVLRSPMGLQRTSEDDALVWVELHTTDPDAAVRFYGGVFGWRSADMTAPGMTYQVLSIADGDQQEGAFGGVAPLQGGPGGPALGAVLRRVRPGGRRRRRAGRGRDGAHARGGRPGRRHHRLAERARPVRVRRAAAEPAPGLRRPPPGGPALGRPGCSVTPFRCPSRRSSALRPRAAH
ncbi:VOC family protein [Streptomyces sp. NPDC059168]|uniref:VOC family protein n=1 Tax=Streptomyces sp. NPDC059168 TaxID=3346753 RepID=UPI00369549E8